MTMALKDFSEGRTDQYKIDPRKLQIKDGWNTRDFSDPANIAHIEELSKSIAEMGVKRALVVNVENDVPYVVDGECRYRAVMLAIDRGADIKTVPVVGEDRFANDADRLFGQLIYNSGKPFGPIENARLFKRLLDMGWQQKDIATKSGMTGGRISQLLELLILPISLQKFITEGKASANMVMLTFKKHNGDEAATLAELEAALGVAQEAGRKRALPKDTGEGGEGDGGSKGSEKGSKNSLKKHLKAMVEKAYAEERIDDTENMVTMSIPEADWAELMEMIDY
jgi:ParB/RepB/Spo0J family partition protein